MRKKETPNPSRVRGRGVEVSETLFYIGLGCFDALIMITRIVS